MPLEKQDNATLEVELMSHEVPGRPSQAALLSWFLSAVWRLDAIDVMDALTDGPGDKGIDGIWIDESNSEIVIFQSHRVDDATKKTEGDAKIKGFTAVRNYFVSTAAYDAMLASSPSAQLVATLARLKVHEYVAAGTHNVRLVYVTNAALDGAGTGQVAVLSADPDSRFEVFAGPELAGIAKNTKSSSLVGDEVRLTVRQEPMVVQLTPHESLAVAVVRATSLIELPGIVDQSLFARNVRLAMGRTKINRELASTLKDPAEHALFPAYHNGLTVLTHGMAYSVDDSQLVLDQVGVVNGCQSVSALYAAGSEKVQDLNVLVKVVVVPRSSDISDRITYRSNNQNAVSARDQRSNDPSMRHLQAALQASYGPEVFFQIKYGEVPPQGAVVIDNLDVAQAAMATYVGQPWAAVRRLKLMDQDFRSIFDRRLDQHRVLFLHLLGQAVDKHRGNLSDAVQPSYAAVRFTLMSMVFHLLKETPDGKSLVDDPSEWLATPESRSGLGARLSDIGSAAVETMNLYLEEKLAEADDDGTIFDPKVSFKSQKGAIEARAIFLRDAKRLDRQKAGFYFRK